MELEVGSSSHPPDRLARALAGLFEGPVGSAAPFDPRHDAAERALADYDVAGYAATRNRLDGNVSRLNPYVSWGVFTLPEVQAAVQARHPQRDADLRKFLDELGWKAFFREAFRALGGRVYRSLEPYKYPTAAKRPGPPPGAERGATGLRCIDAIAEELTATGYLHNHARLWFASWWVHYAGHAWQDGEAFFYRHLLDGEPGPNALGWQWVASTFGAKPYLFNVANMRRNGHPGCDGAPFDASYEELSERYFGGYGRGGYARRPRDQPQARPEPPLPRLVRDPGADPVVLLHAERLSLRARPLAELPHAPLLVVLDGRRLRRERPAFLRLRFAVELAADLVRRARDEGRSAQLRVIDDEAEIAAAVAGLGGASVATPDSWHPGTWRTLDRLDALAPVSVLPETPFATVRGSLRSFTAYWREARPQVTAR